MKHTPSIKSGGKRSADGFDVSSMSEEGGTQTFSTKMPKIVTIKKERSEWELQFYFWNMIFSMNLYQFIIMGVIVFCIGILVMNFCYLRLCVLYCHPLLSTYFNYEVFYFYFRLLSLIVIDEAIEISVENLISFSTTIEAIHACSVFGLVQLSDICFLYFGNISNFFPRYNIDIIKLVEHDVT